MALIAYPLPNWNTFADVAAADAIIGNYVNDGGYLILDDPEKEAILAQTALQIKLCNNIKLPTDNESDLQQAQCYLVVHALQVDMLGYDSSSKAIIEEHAGDVGVSYDARMKPSDATAFPPMTKALLSQYGCRQSSGGFIQGYAGRS